MSNQDRRQNDRFPVHQEGLLCNLTRRAKAETAIIKDLSSGGCSVESCLELWTGDAVAVSADNESFLGEVVHARQEKQKWVAGLNFERRLSETDLSRLLKEYSAPDKIGENETEAV